MEVQTIQARTQVRFVGNPGKCEDCEEEQRLEDALKEDIAEDRVNLSASSLTLSNSTLNSGELENGEGGDEEQSSSSNQVGPKTELELTEEERRVLNELKARDAEVRAHEAAHLAAAGPHANGGATYEYQTGPDGKQYAVGGEVSIDTSPVPGNPEATARKAQAIKRAALAPRDPSAQDRKVAAQAAQLEAQARQEARAEKTEETKEATESGDGPSSIEGGFETESNAQNGNSSSQNESTPFARRVAKQFNPSSTTSGNLLNVIS